MSNDAALLIKHGFIKSKYKDLYKDKTSSEIQPEHADQEEWEESKDNFIKTSYPLPIKRFRIISEAYNLSMEESYFWILNYIQQDLGYHNVRKIIDTFAASENSAFFGVSQQRLGLQQEKVSQYLMTIGKMVKELFQLVRELRIIDERLVYYEESWRNIESSEITLKGIFIDMVQGGAKNPASVFGMAREVQFVSLPDLFFSTHPQDENKLDEYIDKERSGFNKSVRAALKRNLKQYLVWKKKTYDELKTRRVFTLKYLRQQYDIIKMYMVWVRPYLKHIQRLTLDDEKADSAHLISAFEGSMIEVEFLASRFAIVDKTKKTNTYVHSCILAHFLFRTRPSMSYQQEGYQRGPIHVGRLEFNLRGYAWTKEQIDNYIKMKDAQDLELLKTISDSVKAAMEALGGELEKYLEESGSVIESKKEEKKAGAPTILQRFKAEFVGKKPVKAKAKKKEKPSEIEMKSETTAAADMTKSYLFYCFKNYKKAHRMIMW